MGIGFLQRGNIIPSGSLPMGLNCTNRVSTPILGDKLPQLPRSLLPKAWAVPQSLVDVYMEFNANGCCVVGGDYHLSESYILRLTAAMDDVFYEKYGVQPTLVADVHQYVYKRTGEPTGLSFCVPA